MSSHNNLLSLNLDMDPSETSEMESTHPKRKIFASFEQIF